MTEMTEPTEAREVRHAPPEECGPEGIALPYAARAAAADGRDRFVFAYPGDPCFYQATYLPGGIDPTGFVQVTPEGVVRRWRVKSPLLDDAP